MNPKGVSPPKPYMGKTHHCFFGASFLHWQGVGGKLCLFFFFQWEMWEGQKAQSGIPPLDSHLKYSNNLPGSSQPIPREGGFSFPCSDLSQRQMDNKSLWGGTVGWEGEDPAAPIPQELPSFSSPTALLPKDWFSAQENRAFSFCFFFFFFLPFYLQKMFNSSCSY